MTFAAPDDATEKEWYVGPDADNVEFRRNIDVKAQDSKRAWKVIKRSCMR